MKIKAIVFDCFGVLTEDRWHAFRIALPDGPKQEAQDLMHQYGAGFIDAETFVHEVVAVTGAPESSIRELISEELGKNVQLLRYIAELKGRGYKLGILSNIASNWIKESFLTDQEQSMFDDMLFSFEAGMTKPDPRIFEMAANRLGLQPGECLFVDDIERYVTEAKEVGMRAVVYEDFDQCKNDLEKILTSA